MAAEHEGLERRGKVLQPRDHRHLASISPHHVHLVLAERVLGDIAWQHDGHAAAAALGLLGKEVGLNGRELAPRHRRGPGRVHQPRDCARCGRDGRGGEGTGQGGGAPLCHSGRGLGSSGGLGSGGGIGGGLSGGLSGRAECLAAAGKRPELPRRRLRRRLGHGVGRLKHLDLEQGKRGKLRRGNRDAPMRFW